MCWEMCLPSFGGSDCTTRAELWLLCCIKPDFMSKILPDSSTGVVGHVGCCTATGLRVTGDKGDLEVS